jgi:hypothetical protein
MSYLCVKWNSFGLWSARHVPVIRTRVVFPWPLPEEGQRRRSSLLKKTSRCHFRQIRFRLSERIRRRQSAATLVRTVSSWNAPLDYSRDYSPSPRISRLATILRFSHIGMIVYPDRFATTSC